MPSLFVKIFAALTSLFIFMLGNGLFNTLVPLRLQAELAPTYFIGMIGAAYYAGLVLGSFRIERFIIRVGHIRAFSAFASGLAVICVLHGFYYNPWLWLVMRFLGGFATAGLFIVIESWLLLLGTIKTRGRILSYYMLVLYAGQALGQFLINLDSTANLTLYTLAGMLGTLSVLPVAMSKVAAPQIEEVSELDLMLLLKKAPAALFGSYSSGLILGSVYGLFPIYLQTKTNGAQGVSLFMALIILGGTAFQYPVGKVSDFYDRRSVLTVVSIAACVASLLVTLSFHSYLLALVNVFVLGGMIFTLYPLSITYACDALGSQDIVAGTQAMLFAYSIGATMGPLISPGFMLGLGNEGLPIFFASVSGVLTLLLIWRRLARKAVPPEENYLTVTQTTPVIIELDPRTD